MKGAVPRAICAGMIGVVACGFRVSTKVHDPNAGPVAIKPLRNLDSACGTGVEQLVAGRTSLDEVMGIDWKHVDDVVLSFLSSRQGDIQRLGDSMVLLQAELDDLGSAEVAADAPDSDVEGFIKQVVEGSFGFEDLESFDKAKCQAKREQIDGKREKMSQSQPRAMQRVKETSTALAKAALGTKMVSRDRFNSICKKKLKATCTLCFCSNLCEELALVAFEVTPKSSADAGKRTELVSKLEALAEQREFQKGQVDKCGDLRSDLNELGRVLEGVEKSRGESKTSYDSLRMELSDLTEELQDAADLKDDLTEKVGEAEEVLKEKTDIQEKIQQLADEHKAHQQKLKTELLAAKAMVEELSNKYAAALAAVTAIDDVKALLAVEMRSMVDFHNNAIRVPLEAVIGRDGSKLAMFEKPDTMGDAKIIRDGAQQVLDACVKNAENLKGFALEPGPEISKDWRAANDGAEAKGLPDICDGIVQKPDVLVDDIIEQITREQRTNDDSPVKLLTTLKATLQAVSATETPADNLSEPTELARFLRKYKTSVFTNKYLQFWETPQYFVKLQEQLAAARDDLAGMNEKYNAQVATLTMRIKAAQEKRKELTEQLFKATQDANKADKQLLALRASLDSALQDEASLEKSLRDLEEKIQATKENIAKLEKTLVNSHKAAMTTTALLELHGLI